LHPSATIAAWRARSCSGFSQAKVTQINDMKASG
jgi:hypothetical protein